MEERYQLIESLGVGGMASVHKGYDRVLEREVAIKRLLPHLASDDEAARRFRREAQAAAGLTHPGIVTVFDAGVDESGPYIVMELIHGETLASRIAEQGPFEVAGAVAIVRSAAEALDHAHAKGVIHRDVKPSNLILDREGGVRLTDFGIAQAVADPTVTAEPGQVMGTLAYIAPEILAGEPATPASDVYSLAAVAYEMLTGHPPFQADNVGALLNQVAGEQPAPLSGDTPPEVAAGVMRALNKDPARRPRSAGALATALMAGTTVPIPVETKATMPIPVLATEPEVESPAGANAAKDRRGFLANLPWLVLIALGVALAVISLASGGGGELGALGTTTTTTTTPTTTTLPATTTTSLPSTTTSLPPDSPKHLADLIYEKLDEMKPPDYPPPDIKKVEERLDEVMKTAEKDDREELGDRLGDALVAVTKLPDKPATEELMELFTRLAEAFGFEVAITRQEGEGNGGGGGD